MEGNEKYIVDKIRNHREEMDLENLWAGIATEIPKEKKKRRIGFWIFGGLMMGMMAISFFWMTENKTLDTSAKRTSEILTSENDDIQSENNSISIKDQAKEEGQDGSKLNTPELLSNDIKHEQKKVDSNIAPNSISSDQVTVKTTQTENQSTLITSTIINPTQQNNQHETGSENLNTTVNDSSIDEYLTPNAESTVRNDMSSISQLPMHTFFLERDQKPSFPRLGTIVKIEKPSPKKINRWSIYMAGGVGLVNRNLQAKSQDLKPERDRRNAIVNALGSWEVEGGIGFRIHPKVTMKAGLNYTQIHEKAEFQTDYLVDVESTTSQVIHRQDGTIENEIITTTGQEVKTIMETRFNNLRIVQVPISVSYQVMSLDRFKFNVGVFGAYSFHQRYAGFTSFSATQESYDLQLDKDNKFRQSGALSFGAFVEGTTHLTRTLDLSLSLGFKQIKNINREIYLIDQQYNLLTISSGIYRRF